MALQLRSKARTFSNPSFIRLFSTNSSSSSNPSDPSDPNDESNSSSSSQSSLSSYFSDVKASLRQTQSYPRPEPRRPASSSSNHPSFSRPSKIESFDEIRKNLSEFRRATSAPPPTAKSNSTPTSSSPRGSGSSQHISFEELYKQNVVGMAQNAEKSGGGRQSFEAIRESLKQLSSSQNEKKGVDPMSLSTFKNTLRLKPKDSSSSSSSSSSSPSMVIGGTDASPFSLFGEVSREKKDKDRSDAMRAEFVKMYSYGELGEKLKTLRPVAKGDDWFSLGELNDRLIKLRDLEDKETESKIGGNSYRDLRDSLLKLKLPEDEKPKLHRIDILGQLGRTPDFMLQTPKEHLVEKYFHPDNMSSEEKLKIELAKVRDEFKMSESDCGSARVQVAQLTTKIKHLSSVLHKKDKHSRKGLLAMVQRRKRILKYLRRKDWESYCLVLDKLGLRDNPDYKH
ncbi:uncharacterized protein LOC107414102 [Ziziphus jujuba]|uniref:Small ribosomal subunit protein uS15c n=1 Tax=Ziziphus jujuba TaxID=326968 RepID=A0A6P3ZGL3_ZIZJJ|nr:uncharacterized protein LOC107414102 [Ziziphus jujuba]